MLHYRHVFVRAHVAHAAVAFHAIVARAVVRVVLVVAFLCVVICSLPGRCVCIVASHS